MKNILCFGDSLTWGYNPSNHKRYPFEQRWTGVLQKQLGDEYKVIEEALNGRTTVFDDPFMPYRNGSLVLPVLLESHSPIDLLIILLGSNDIKPYRQVSAKEAAIGCGGLINLALKSAAGPEGKAPQILLLTPPKIKNPKNWAETMFKGSENESESFSLHYERAADRYHAHFLDSASFITPSKADGVHLEPSENKRLGEEVAKKIKKIFK